MDEVERFLRELADFMRFRSITDQHVVAIRIPKGEPSQTQTQVELRTSWHEYLANCYSCTSLSQIDLPDRQILDDVKFALEDIDECIYRWLWHV
jgi:hypothetical protein